MWTYDITCTADPHGPRFSTREEAEYGCRSFCASVFDDISGEMGVDFVPEMVMRFEEEP